MSLRDYDTNNAKMAISPARDATLLERVGQLEHDLEKSRTFFNQLVDDVRAVEYVLEHRLGIKAEPLPKAMDKEG